jgi:hypothetical protein
MANETELINTTATLTPNSFSYSGHSFNGWNTAARGGGVSYADAANYLFSTSVTLYAQWTATTPTPFAGSSTTNWSGYVLSSGSVLTQTSAQWTVPTLNCADTANATSSTWVGTGGVTGPTGGSSGPLLQTGTEDDCVNGVQHDAGWWELVPNTPNYSDSFSNFTVAPGNTMAAYVYQEPSGAWVTQLNDLTTGLSGTMITGEGWGVGPIGASFTYQGSTAGVSYIGADTAEWIVEDVTNAQSSSLFSFANYGSVTFSNLTTDLASWYLAPSDGVEIVQNGVTLSVPSPIDNGEFTVTYSGP